MLSSRDGYCTLIIFDEILPAHNTQQHTLQLQSIAHHNSVPLTFPNSATPSVTPSSTHTSLPFVVTPTVPKKRSEPPLTPTTSVDGDSSQSASTSSYTFPTASATARDKQAAENTGDKTQGPPKKKRRVALTRVADLDA